MPAQTFTDKNYLDLTGLQSYHQKLMAILEDVGGLMVAEDDTLAATVASAVNIGKPVLYKRTDGANILILDSGSSPVRHFGILCGTTPAFCQLTFSDYAAETTTMADGVYSAISDATTLQAAKDYADGVVEALETGAVQDNANAIAVLNGNESTDGSVKKAVKDASDAINTTIGTLASLDTTTKDSVVAAINEIVGQIEAVQTSEAVTIDTGTTTEGMAKSYQIKQGGVTVGTIDIPKDMVVSSGAVEVNPSGQAPGTYIVLTLANATSDKIYVNVATLVDIYVAEQSATQVQLTINPVSREISAAIVAGSISAAELAANAVTTVKIADGNVTKAKLESTVQTSLDKADSALQPSDITTGGANGTIAVKGADVAVKGLGTAAYTTVGAASGNVPEVGTALGTTANVPVVVTAEGKLAPHASGALKSAAFQETSAFDGAGSAQNAYAAIKSISEEQISALFS